MINVTKRFWVRAIVAVLLPGLLACTRTVHVPVSSLSGEERLPMEAIHVVTVDGTVHKVTKWTLTDSTIVAEAVVVADRWAPRPDLPYTIPLASVDHVDKTELARGRSFFLLAGAFLLFMAVYGLATLEIGM